MQIVIRPIQEQDQNEIFEIWRNGILVDHCQYSLKYFLAQNSIRFLFFVNCIVLPFYAKCYGTGCFLALLLYFYLWLIARRLGKDHINQRDDMKDIVAHYGKQFIIAEHALGKNESKIIGGIAYFAYFGSTFEITSLSVLPEYRKNGIATRLIRKIEEIAFSEQMSIYLSTTCMQLPALKLYRRLGYAESTFYWTDWVKSQNLLTTFITKHILQLKIHQFQKRKRARCL